MKPKHDSLDGIDRVTHCLANPHKYNHSPQASAHHVPRPISGQSHDIRDLPQFTRYTGPEQMIFHLEKKYLPRNNI